MMIVYESYSRQQYVLYEVSWRRGRSMIRYTY